MCEWKKCGSIDENSKGAKPGWKQVKDDFYVIHVCSSYKGIEYDREYNYHGASLPLGFIIIPRHGTNALRNVYRLAIYPFIYFILYFLFLSIFYFREMWFSPSELHIIIY